MCMKNEIMESYLKTIYTKGIIVKAICDYKEICKISMNENEKSFMCVFMDGITDLNRIRDEFSNYLIELSNQIGERK